MKCELCRKDIGSSYFIKISGKTIEVCYGCYIKYKGGEK